MKIDESICKDVLDDYITSIQKDTPNTLSIKSLSRLVRKLNSHDGIQFSHIIPILAATNKGFFLTSNKAFSDLRIERLFFAQLEAFDEVNTDLSNILRDGEAIIISPKVTGTKMSLSWFRSIFWEQENSSYKAYDSGFPNLGIAGAISMLQTEKWKLASSKGRISKQILKHITPVKSQGNFTILFHGDKKLEADLLDRIESLYNKISTIAEISCWHLRKKSKPSDDSLLAEAWFTHNKGHFLRAPSMRRS